MIPELYPHQKDLRVDIRVAARSYQSILAYGPTGVGKTNLSAALIKSIFDAGKRVIFAVHRSDLLFQTGLTFKRFGITFSYIAAGHHYNPYHRVFIASIPTLQNRLGRYPADWVFIDEAHLSASAGWSKTINHYKSKGSKLIGLTGSPERLDGKPLGDVWDTLVEGPSVRWLIEKSDCGNGRGSVSRSTCPLSLMVAASRMRVGLPSMSMETPACLRTSLTGAARKFAMALASSILIFLAPANIRLMADGSTSRCRAIPRTDFPLSSSFLRNQSLSMV